MKLSDKSVEATRRNSGRSASRPTSTMVAMAAKAWTSAWARPASSEPPPFWAPSTLTRKSSGMTAMSWQSRMAKLARPADDVIRFLAESSSTTIAVEERARPKPMIRAAAAGWPSA